MPDECTALKSDTFKSCKLNERVVILQSLSADGCDNKYGILLDNTGRGLLEFSDDEADYADDYIIRPVNSEELVNDQFKAFLTRMGADKVVPPPKVARYNFRNR